MSANVPERPYNWACVSYQPLEELQYTIDKASKYAYILHDKDCDEDGVLRAPHYHLLLHFDTSKSFNQVKKLLNTNNISKQNNFAEVIIDKLKCYEYLTHINYPEKYQYSEDDIQTNCRSFWNFEKEEKNFFELIEDIPKLTMRQMAKKWGRDYIINYKKYNEFYDDMIKQEKRIENIEFAKKHNLQNLSEEDITIISKF